MRALRALGLAWLLAAPAAAGPQARAGAETVSSFDTYGISRGETPAQLSKIDFPADVLKVSGPLADPALRPPVEALSPYSREQGSRLPLGPADVDAASLRAFLGGMKTVRIGVPSAPGNGHQAVGATIAKRLRELGFKGDLQFAFDNSVREKMDLTLPGYDPLGPSRQRLELLGGEAGPDRAFDADPAPDLYIAAADGTRVGMGAGSDVRISVQPFHWGTSDVSVAGEHYRTPVSEKALMFAPPAPEDPAAFLARSMSGSQRLREKIAGLQALERGLAGRDVLPAYGLSHNWQGVKRLLLALDKARRLSPAALPSGVVVPLFSNLSDADVRDLRRALSPLPRQRLSIASVRDAHGLRAALGGLRPGRILLVRVGGVAQDVFEYFYSRATLPGTAAGLNAQNMLRVMGRPFVVTGTYYDQGLQDVYSKLGSEGAKQLRAAIGSLQDGSEDVTPLARFFLLAKDPSSSVSLAFRLAQPTELRHDKVALLIDRARRAVEASAARPAVPAAVAETPPGAAAAPSRRRRFADALRSIPLVRRLVAAGVD